MAMTRVNFRGVTVSTRTRDMIVEAERLLGWKLVPVQGSYNKGGVGASAGTHDGGGAIDLRARDLTAAKKSAAVTALRRVGFAAWHRVAIAGVWVEHIHAIAIADAELSSGAKNQVADYKSGRNGLANNGKDNGTRAYVNVTWEKYKASLNRPVLHAWSINYATSGKGMSGTTLTEARRFIGFSKELGAISQYVSDQWQLRVAAGNWTDAARIYKDCIKAVQKKAHISQDGVFGRQTGDFVDNYGYRIVY